MYSKQAGQQCSLLRSDRAVSSAGHADVIELRFHDHTALVFHFKMIYLAAAYTCVDCH